MEANEYNPQYQEGAPQQATAGFGPGVSSKNSDLAHLAGNSNKNQNQSRDAAHQSNYSQYEHEKRGDDKRRVVVYVEESEQKQKKKKRDRPMTAEEKALYKKT